MITTRFAPSPTGYLHIGSLRTVLYNYLYTKKNDGKFMLRVEDTDRTRYVEGSIENMISILSHFSLDPDEWPNNPGDLWPYYQSERLDIYKKYIEELIYKWYAYYCFCTPERLDNLRQEQQDIWLPTKYDGHCRYLSEEEIRDKLNNWEPYTIRLKVPKGRKISFLDTVKGMIEIDSKDVDEQVLMKSDWFPTYHFANVVDDHLMWVTHVIRWDEWTPSTPKHILLYEAFGWDPPEFSHIPLLLWVDKKKLSKRTWDVSVEIYLQKWFLPEAIINYIALLGWNPKTTEEIFSLEELIERFDLRQVHKAGAIFDVEKLEWFNAKYIQNQDINILYEELSDYLKVYDLDFYENTFSKASSEYNKSILKELQTRLKTFGEFKSLTTFFYSEPDIAPIELFLNPKMKIDSTEILGKWLSLIMEILKEWHFNNYDEMKNIFIEKIKEVEMKNGQVLWPVRVALSGEEFSSWAFELIWILWLEKSIQRIEKVLKSLN